MRPEIQTVEDLRGKTIGVTRLKAITDVAARLAFQRLGLQPDVDVFTRGTGGQAESLAAMEAGALDGAQPERAASVRGAPARLPRADGRRGRWAFRS